MGDTKLMKRNLGLKVGAVRKGRSLATGPAASSAAGPCQMHFCIHTARNLARWGARVF